MPITACKGTVDILPHETPHWRHVESVAHRVAQHFGFKELRTPAFEVTELFVEAIGEDTDIIEREIYTFRDKSGKSLALRPELTVPTVRAFLEHGLGSQAALKAYYLGEIWRHERPIPGRMREAHQFGVEALGSASPSLDAELVDLAMTFFTTLGLKDLRLEVNSVGCRKCRPAYQQVLRDFFTGKDDVLCPDCERRKERNPLRILDCRKEGCLGVTATAPTVFQSLCSECRTHFFTFKDHLAQMGFAVHGNPRVVQSMGYYTRTVFQIVSSHLGPQNALCMGGRFDDLVTQLGSASPACAIGFAVGLEKTLAAMEKEGIEFPPEPPLDVFLVGTGEEAERIITRTLHHLRKRGYRAERDYSARGVKNQLKLAEKMTPRFTVVVGEEDTRVTQVVVHDNGRGSQETLGVNRLVDGLEFRLRRDVRERKGAPQREQAPAEESSRRSERGRGGRDRGRDEERERGRGEGRGDRGRQEAAPRGDRERRREPEREVERERAGDREGRPPRGEHGRDRGGRVREEPEGDDTRFAEWAAAYSEAARTSPPRPPRRVPFSEQAFEADDPEGFANAEAWAMVQVGLAETPQGMAAPWPSQPMTLMTGLPPRREPALVAEAPARLHPEDLYEIEDHRMAPLDEEGLEDEDGQDEDGQDEGSLAGVGAGQAGAGEAGDRKKRGGRRGGRRHGRRKSRGSRN